MFKARKKKKTGNSQRRTASTINYDECNDSETSVKIPPIPIQRGGGSNKSIFSSTRGKRKPTVILEQEHSGSYSVENLESLRQEQQHAVPPQEKNTEPSDEEESFISLDHHPNKKVNSSNKVSFEQDVYHDETSYCDQSTTIEDDIESRDWELEQIKRGGHQVLYDEKSRSETSYVKVLSLQEIEKKLSSSIHTLEQTATLTERDLENLGQSVFDLQRDIKDSKITLGVQSKRFTFFQSMRDFISDVSFCMRNKLKVIQTVEKELQDARGRRDKNQQRLLAFMKSCIRQIQLRNSLCDSSIIMKDSGTDDEIIPCVDALMQKSPHQEVEEDESYLSPKYVFDDIVTKDKKVRSLEVSNMIKESLGCVFEDVEDEVKDFVNVLSRLESWKKEYPKSYHDAYVAYALPKIVSPYLQVELLGWEPLYESTSKSLIERFKCLDTLKRLNDDTEGIVSVLVESEVVPRILKHFQLIDPYSIKQSTYLCRIVKEVFELNEGFQKEFHESFKQLFSKAFLDLQVPVIVLSDVEALEFAIRQLKHAVRLMYVLLVWRKMALLKSTVDSMITRAFSVMVEPFARHVLQSPKIVEAATCTEEVVQVIDTLCQELRPVLSKASMEPIEKFVSSTINKSKHL